VSISSYQIRNVLRIYGSQLKRRANLPEGAGVISTPSIDTVDISVEARRKQVLEQLAGKLISQLSPRDHSETTPTADEGRDALESTMGVVFQGE
jgi:hypothetical protein